MNTHSGRIGVLLLFLVATGAIPVAVTALSLPTPALPQRSSAETSILESESHPVESTPLLPFLQEYLPASFVFLDAPSLGCELRAEILVVGLNYGIRAAAERSPPSRIPA